MLWVAFDRALRLAEKRNFPCPERQRWLTARDSIYELIMEKGFNKKMNSFVQSFESNTQLDASSLIGPLVFFIAPNDPRFLGTLDRILKPPTKGGLTSAGFVFRYDTDKVDDGKIAFVLYSLRPFLAPSVLKNPASLYFCADLSSRCWWCRRHLHNLHDVADRGTHSRLQISDRPPSTQLRHETQDVPSQAGLSPPRQRYVRKCDELRQSLGLVQ